MINPINTNKAFLPPEKKEIKPVKETNDSRETETNRNEEVTYRKTISNIDIEEIKRLKKEAEDALAPLREMVASLLKEQGIYLKESQEIEVDEKTRAEAKSLISEGGAYSVENTARRIFDFAISMAGGDKSKISRIRAAIDKGFKEAEKAFGKLPDISQQTYNLVMEKLDEWEKGVEIKSE